ncbi:EAL domain-containing protein [Halobacillus sp. Nhm2S1]|uniref:sensor domain-containing protein n=1 Tax=Halobacillus sp. Nhm2S1 TaxID=2866716 RepID=UPI001C72DE0E|nr:EAL domain-containing protein [Halobacillus sp. Nhm2S1]MBX0356678.1 EAL domain-containing protein [Halobacillus sp. Nhm2S1]
MSDRLRELALPIDEWIYQQMNDALLFVDAEGRLLRFNEKSGELIDGDVQSLLDLLDFHQLKKEEAPKMVELSPSGGCLYKVQCRQMEHDRSLYAIFLQPVPMLDQTFEVKKKMEQRLVVPSEGMVIHDKGKIIDCDHTLASMFGYKKEEMVKQDAFTLTSEREHETLHRLFLSYPEQPYVLQAVKKDGTPFYIEVLAHPYPQEGRILRVAIVRDITERVHNERKIEFMSYYDELTELPNRYYFMDMVKEAIEEKEGLAVHFIDLDYFKQINDTLGYSFGDELLKACASRLKQHQGADTFMARMGGDEFLVLQRQVNDQKDAECLAQKLIEAFREPVVIDGYELYTSVSIGISLYPQHGKTAGDLIKQADSAMYTVKEQQRNDYLCYNASISEEFEQMLSIDSELRKALKENQLELHYQPQKSIHTGEIVGLEALIRWNHPEKGRISPATFIPVAEKNGQIFEIGDWVIREACRQNKQWQEEGFPAVIVGVNLSALQFLQKDLVSRVKQVLEETGLDPMYLELEITESMAMTNEEYIIQTLNDLRNLGVHVSIDDFGTGYSSLKYLSRFPVSKLKIDKVFISENQVQNQAIVKSIIHMSHSLNMKVIAEGVETAEQWDFLKSEKCDEIQGYFYSKPLPPEELITVFENKSIH